MVRHESVEENLEQETTSKVSQQSSARGKEWRNAYLVLISHRRKESTSVRRSAKELISSLSSIAFPSLRRSKGRKNSTLEGERRSDVLLKNDGRLLLELGVGPLDLELEVMHLSLTTSKVSHSRTRNAPKAQKTTVTFGERCQKDDDDE